MKEPKVTIKIPRPLYRRIKMLIERSGFDSPTDFIVYVLRDLVGEQIPGREEREVNKKELTPDEIRAIRQRLENLGYL
jgi:Arc/MetJ-type ribon-helix-helix transcriptional regulator